MTLAQLRYAVAVDTHRHFGRAADACFVSQPTLSAALKKLEAELGAVLFDRSRQPVVPTAAGERVVAQARVVLRESAALAGAAGEGMEPSGPLRLGVIPTVAESLLPLVTGPFASRYPKVELSILELTTDAILEQLATERIDAGILATQEERAGLQAEVLYAEPFVAYVGEGHRMEAVPEVACERLSPGDVWLLSEGHCFRDQVLHLCGSAPSGGTARSVRFESGSLETLRRMVDRTGGVTLLPRLATHYLDPSQSARLRPLAAPVPQREIRMVTLRAHLKRRALAAFADVAREAVRVATEPENEPT